MLAQWFLVVVLCSGPGPSGMCDIQKHAPVYDGPACRQAAIREEMMDERKRAWCQRLMEKVNPYSQVGR